MARTTSKKNAALDVVLSTGQISLVNRFVSKVAREAGLAATSLNSAGLPKTVGGAVALLGTVSNDSAAVADLHTLLANSEGTTKRDVLAVLNPKAAKKATKRTAKKAAPKKATVKQQPKAEAPAKTRGQVKDLDAAALRLAKSPEGIRIWWAKAHADQIKEIGLKADGSVVKGGKIAKAMANA